MAKRAFLIHGWGGKAEGGFRPWLKIELEKNGFLVESLSMPNSETPDIEKWLLLLRQKIKLPDQSTYLIGHSLGAAAILMYLEDLREKIKVGKVILIAGAFKKINDLTPEQQIIAEPWLKHKYYYNKIIRSSKSIAAFFSDNDHLVPIENHDVAEKLHAKIIIEHNMAHYNEEAGIVEVPEVLKEILAK